MENLERKMKINLTFNITEKEVKHININCDYINFNHEQTGEFKKHKGLSYDEAKNSLEISFKSIGTYQL
jgi:hypothetical protein